MTSIKPRARIEVNAWNDECVEMAPPAMPLVLGAKVGRGLGSVSQQTLVVLVRGQQNFPKPRSSQPRCDVHGSDLNWLKYGSSQQLPPQQFRGLPLRPGLQSLPTSHCWISSKQSPWLTCRLSWCLKHSWPDSQSASFRHNFRLSVSLIFESSFQG